jgi:hypothetical protein
MQGSIKKTMTNFTEIWNGPSFLNRKPSALRMAERDEAGKHLKKHKKPQKMKHADEDFWEVWENENK